MPCLHSPPWLHSTAKFPCRFAPLRGASLALPEEEDFLAAAHPGSTIELLFRRPEWQARRGGGRGGVGGGGWWKVPGHQGCAAAAPRAGTVLCCPSAAAPAALWPSPHLPLPCPLPVPPRRTAGCMLSSGTPRASWTPRATRCPRGSPRRSSCSRRQARSSTWCLTRRAAGGFGALLSASIAMSAMCMPGLPAGARRLL